MGKERGQAGWMYWLLWAITNTVVGGSEVFVLLALAPVVSRIPFQGSFIVEISVTMLMYVVVFGAIVGALQLFFLRQRFEIEALLWMLAAIVAFSIYAIFQFSVFTMGIMIDNYGFDIINQVPILRVTQWLIDLHFSRWLILVTIQLLILRRYFAYSGWWIMATVVALWTSMFFVPSWIMGGLGEYDGRSLLYGNIASNAASAFVYAVVTAIAFSIISKQPKVAIERIDSLNSEAVDTTVMSKQDDESIEAD